MRAVRILLLSPGSADRSAGRPRARAGAGTLQSNEILDTGHRFFGGVSRGLASVVETRVLDLGSAERLRARPGRRRRVHRRTALRRRRALHQERRRPERLLAGPDARLGRGRRRRAHHDAGLQSPCHPRDLPALRRRRRLGLYRRRRRHDGADVGHASSWCRSAPAWACGSAPTSAI